MTNVWIAAADNNREAVAAFLRDGGSPNSQDENGYSPLHAAASYGHLDLLRTLVEAGGNINLADGEGDTPLHHVEDLRTAIVMVKEMNADPSAKNHDGMTPAEFMEDNDEYPDVVKYLRGVASGVDLESELVREKLAEEEKERQAKQQSRKRGASGEPAAVPAPEPAAESAPAEGEPFAVKYSVQADDEDENDPAVIERRKKIDEIMRSDNPEEGMRDYLANALSQGLLDMATVQSLSGQMDEPEAKRKRDQ
ncbi:hypothetical protein DICA4_D12970 [Diutina catenulata]